MGLLPVLIYSSASLDSMYYCYVAHFIDAESKSHVHSSKIIPINLNFSRKWVLLLYPIYRWEIGVTGSSVTSQEVINTFKIGPKGLCIPKLILTLFPVICRSYCVSENSSYVISIVITKTKASSC